VSRVYHLVMFESGKAKGISAAMQKIIPEEDAKKILMESAATIICERGEFKVSEKRLFELEDKNGNKTLFIICDVINNKSNKRGNILVR